MPKLVDHPVYREELLRKSFHLFAEKGYSKITIRQIAQELNISTGRLYHYFDSKESLFSEMLNLLVMEDVSQLQSFVRSEKFSIPQNSLTELFRFIRSKEFYFQSVLLMVCDAYRHFDTEKELNALKNCLEVYRKGVQNYLKFSDPEMEGILLSIAIGTIFQNILDPGGIDYDKTLTTIMRFIFNDN